MVVFEIHGYQRLITEKWHEQLNSLTSKWEANFPTYLGEIHRHLGLQVGLSNIRELYKRFSTQDCWNHVVKRMTIAKRGIQNPNLHRRNSCTTSGYHILRTSVSDDLMASSGNGSLVFYQIDNWGAATYLHSQSWSRRHPLVGPRPRAGPMQHKWQPQSQVYS
jgi:hypothetical protein